MKITLQYLALLSFILTTALASNTDLALRKTGARKHGADGLFSLEKYRLILMPAFYDSKIILNPVIQVGSEYLIDNKKVYFKQIMDEKIKIAKKESTNQDTVSFVDIEDYPFITISVRDSQTYLKVDDVSDGFLVINYKGKNLYFKPDEKIEKEHPSMFSYNHLFHISSEQGELDKELDKLPAFTQLITELRKCIKDKDEDCFSKYLRLSNKDKNDVRYLQRKIKTMKEVFLRAHIEADPKASKYYEKTRRTDIDEDISIPDGIEKMIDRKKSEVWNWMDLLLSLKLKKEDYYLNLKSDDPKNGINEIIIHIKGTNLSLYFVKDDKDSKWYVDDMQLTTESEGLN